MQSAPNVHYLWTSWWAQFDQKSLLLARTWRRHLQPDWKHSNTVESHQMAHGIGNILGPQAKQLAQDLSTGQDATSQPGILRPNQIDLRIRTGRLHGANPNLHAPVRLSPYPYFNHSCFSAIAASRDAQAASVILALRIARPASSHNV